jgi:ADP-heptose:LPS heptosyltransferase
LLIFEIMKILILRFSSIGDIVLTTPLVRAIKQQVEDVELHYATKATYRGIVESNPYLDKVHVLEDNINRLVLDLRAEKFDLVLDLHHNIRTQIIKMRLRVKSVSVNKLNLEKWLLTQFKIDKLPKYKHIVDRYIYTAKALGVKKDDGGLDYFIPNQDDVIIADMFPEAREGFVAIAIGAKFLTKRLPYPKIVSICDQINQPIILLGGLDDMARGEEIVHRSTNKRIYNACGKLNLNQSASVVKQADVLITHDTGLMHIAAAFEKKIVSVWGNTVPEFGMYPYQKEENFKIVEVKDLSCRPCSKIGHKKCPKGHFDCMQKIDVDDVVRATADYLKPV